MRVIEQHRSGVIAEGGHKVLYWNGHNWIVELSLSQASSVDPAGLATVSADDAYVIGQHVTTRQPFIEHWDGFDKPDSHQCRACRERICGSCAYLEPARHSPDRRNVGAY
jgi:hypothetical protein